MSNQTIAFRSHSQLAQYKTGHNIELLGERGTSCIDYVIEAKQNKIINKLLLLVPTPKEMTGEKEFNGKFVISETKCRKYSEIIKRISSKEKLIKVIYALESITSREELKKYFSKELRED